MQGWRLFAQRSSSARPFTNMSQAVDHPAAREDTEVVSVDEFYSMWRSRTVDCPWGSGRPAVETLLLHHEQFKIPENLVGRGRVNNLGWVQLAQLGKHVVSLYRQGGAV